MKADVVIIGAGLAGLSAAAEIAAHSQASVVLIEKRGVGSNNPTPMTFHDVPERYGLEHTVIGCYDRFTFHSPLGGRSTHALSSPQLVALDYQKACLTLLDRASAAGDVWVYSGSASGMVRQGGIWTVALNDHQQVTAPLVIDASGRSLFSASALHLPRPRSYSYCYGARLSNVQVPNEHEAFFFAPSAEYGEGGGWLYPLQAGQVSFGYASLGDSPALPGRLVKDRFRRALASFEPYASWFKGADWDHVETGIIPIYPLRRFVYDGLLIAGDAAGQATIWSCMGSEAALEAGQLAGAAAVSALKKDRYTAHALSSYQKSWDSRHRRVYRNNALVAPVVWSMTPQAWNSQIPRVQKLAPERMVARLRTNWPVPSLAQAAFFRAYDVAGRTRRRIAHRARVLWAAFLADPSILK